MALIPITVVLLGLTSCEAPSPEPPAPVQEPAACEPDAKDDVAKAPTKPLAEAILGKWKLVKLVGHPVDPGVELTYEYHADGTVIVRSDDPKNGHRMESGTYRVVNNSIVYFFERRKFDRECIAIIQELAGHKMAITCPDDKPSESSEFVLLDSPKAL